MTRTRISGNTIVTAFLFLDRLKKLHPRCKGSAGSAYRLLLASIMLAAKYLYDDTFDNTAWATVSSGMFTLEQVNHMEMEMLYFLNFGLFVTCHEWITFYDGLNMSMDAYNRQIVAEHQRSAVSSEKLLNRFMQDQHTRGQYPPTTETPIYPVNSLQNQISNHHYHHQKQSRQHIAQFHIPAHTIYKSGHVPNFQPSFAQAAEIQQMHGQNTGLNRNNTQGQSNRFDKSTVQ